MESKKTFWKTNISITTVPYSRECNWPAHLEKGPLKLTTMVRLSGEHIQILSKTIIIYYCMTFFVYNKPKVKFKHSSNHTEQYRIWLYYMTCTTHDCTSGQCIFNWNTSINGHKQGTVAFAQRKPQFIFYNEPRNAKLMNNLLYCSLLHCPFMFRHYSVILRELVLSTLLSYVSMSMQ